MIQSLRTLTATDLEDLRALVEGSSAMPEATRSYQLLGSNGRSYQSDQPGQLGGYRPKRLYGRLDCPSALRAIARGGYVSHRVFFADEPAAIAAGYRPCAKCLPRQYRAWKAQA